MNSYRPLYFTAASEQAAQGEVCFNGIGGDLRHFDKHRNSLVGLFVQQVIQALKIAVAENLVALLFIAARQVPGPSGHCCGQSQDAVLDGRRRPATIPLSPVTGEA